MAAPAPAAAPPPLVLDVHADTLDHVVRAVARSGFLPQAVRLMLASPEHLHDPELLYRTRGVRGAGGRTLLMCAVVRRDVARAAEILGACSTPATRVELLALVDDEGFSALHLACHRDRCDEEAALRLVELLLANGASSLAPKCNPEYKHDVVWHAIHYAARWSARLVQRLVKAGASIDGDVEGTSTLMAAAVSGTAQGVRMIPRLVALGARKIGHNGLMLDFADHPAVGVQPTDGEMVAALSALVSVGYSLTQPDGDGWTPLDEAANHDNAPLARGLLSLGVPATSSSLTRGVSYLEMVRWLLAAGAPVDGLVDDMDGESSRPPLMAAAQYAALESLEALLAAGASVDLRNGIGRTALMWAVDRDNNTLSVTRVVQALLAAGADVGMQDHDGNTALHLAARCHAKPWAAAVARLLRDNGASARTVNEDGETPAGLIPEEAHDGELYRALTEAVA